MNDSEFIKEGGMNKRVVFLTLTCLSFIFFLTNASYSQEALSAKDIVEKNIQAVGGAEKIAKIKNYSFSSDTQRFYMSSDGKMKIVSGKEPVITEVILVSKDNVVKNCFQNITEFQGFMKSTYQALAKLRCGIFSLKNFQDSLQLHGMKKFGPKEHYMLTSKVNELELGFYLDPEEFLINRVVFRGFDPDQGRYEVNHDFGPYEEIEGIKIPSSWFGSQVGTRGNLFEIFDVKFNQDLPEKFFSSYDINIGEVKIKQDALEGNVVDFNIARNNRIMISTNWTAGCLEKAGFSSEDNLILKIAGVQIPLKYFESRPPRNALGPGAKFIMLDQQDKNYLIYIISSEYSEILEKLQLLLPIQLIKSTD